MKQEKEFKKTKQNPHKFANTKHCSQHIQANTTRGFIQSVLLTMGIMMPETC